MVRIDLGCGPHKREGFTGVDSIAFPGVDVVTDLRSRWPWEDSSVDEAHCSHCLEHFTATERVHFMNELWRVLKPGAKCLVIVPHWASGRSYGDPTHQWPPVAEFGFFYWKKAWRLVNAPHTDAEHWPQGFNCDFDTQWNYNLEPSLATRNLEYQQHAVTFFKEAAQDTIATITALKPGSPSPSTATPSAASAQTPTSSAPSPAPSSPTPAAQ